MYYLAFYSPDSLSHMWGVKIFILSGISKSKKDYQS